MSLAILIGVKHCEHSFLKNTHLFQKHKYSHEQNDLQAEKCNSGVLSISDFDVGHGS